MVSYNDIQIIDLILATYNGKRISILSPVIRSRKGHYRELFEQIAKQGFVKVRTDGIIVNLSKGMKLDRYKLHDIEIVIDRLKIDKSSSATRRLRESINTAMYHGLFSFYMCFYYRSKINKITKPNKRMKDAFSMLL